MKKILAKSLKNSLDEERKAEKIKHTNNIEDRFAKAEKIFDQTDKEIDQIKVGNNIQKKVIRDTFTMPSNEYKLINICKARLINKGYSINKSEIIRAGLILLNKLSDIELLKSCEQVEKIKTGRPK